MRAGSLLALTFLVCICPLASIVTATVPLGDDLEVDWEPDELTLSPGEEGDFLLEIRNVGDDALKVGIVHVALDCPGGSSVEISHEFFELGPGASQEVVLVVTSHAKFKQEAWGSNANIDIMWGTNLTREPNGRPDEDTAEGSKKIEIPVRDDFTVYTFLFFGIPIILVIAIISGLILIRQRRARQRAPPDTQPEAPGDQPPDT